MALDVGLAVYIESEAVAKVVEHARLRIVACTDTVDIVLLHQLEVLKHPLAGHVMSCVRICLMEIHTLELHRLTVHEEDVTLDLEAAETYIETCILSLYTKKEGIKFRSFGGPLAHIFHDTFHHCLSSCDEPAVSQDSLSVLVEKLI